MNIQVRGFFNDGTTSDLGYFELHRAEFLVLEEFCLEKFVEFAVNKKTSFDDVLNLIDYGRFKYFVTLFGCGWFPRKVVEGSVADVLQFVKEIDPTTGVLRIMIRVDFIKR